MNYPQTGKSRVRRILLTGVLLAAGTAGAETPLIELNDGDWQRLDIRFAPVQEEAQGRGFEVPATVIASPEQSTQVTALFSGTLTHWHIAGGEIVSAGQTVATLNSAELMALQEQWLAASHHLSDMDQQLARDKQLFDDGIIAEQRLLQTRRTQRQALFGLQARRQQLLQAGVTEADLTALDTGTLIPGAYALKAPQAGVVNRHNFAVGDVISTRQVVASVTNTDHLWLTASLPATLAQGLQAGDKLALANGTASLTLVSKNAEITPTTQQLQIIARFDEAAAYLPGQQVTLALPAGHAGLRVPAAAVTHTESATYVFVRHPQGVEIRELQLMPFGRDYLAAHGLAPGDQVVVQGSAQLKGIQLGLGGGE